MYLKVFHIIMLNTNINSCELYLIFKSTPNNTSGEQGKYEDIKTDCCLTTTYSMKI